MPTPTKEGASLAAGVLKWAVLVVLVLVLAGVGCNALVSAASDDEVVEDTVSVPEPLDEGVYADVELGIRKDVLQAQLEPVRPVEGAVLDRYLAGDPDAVSASCLYYERLGAQRGELYRFCFEQDVLVDKTVVFPGELVDEP